MEKALSHMTGIDSEDVLEQELVVEDDPPMSTTPNGSYFCIEIMLINRRHGVTCTRLNKHMKPHLVPLQMPLPILDYFKKDRPDL